MSVILISSGILGPVKWYFIRLVTTFVISDTVALLQVISTRAKWCLIIYRWRVSLRSACSTAVLSLLLPAAKRIGVQPILRLDRKEPGKKRIRPVTLYNLLGCCRLLGEVPLRPSSCLPQRRPRTIQTTRAGTHCWQVIILMSRFQRSITEWKRPFQTSCDSRTSSAALCPRAGLPQTKRL